jgi:hypothetical protein
MKLDDSNKRISNIIAGILLVFVALVFIALALGVVGNHIYNQDEMDPLSTRLHIGSQINLEDHSSENKRTHSGDIEYIDFVPVDQTCPGGTYNTEEGSISVEVSEYVDGTNDIDGDGMVDEFIFPLCFDLPDPDFDLLLDNWFIIYEVCGGYEPCTDGTYDQWFNIYQQKDGTSQPIGFVNDAGNWEWIGWKLQFISISKAAIAAAQLLPPGEQIYIDSETGREFDVSGITLEDCCCYSYWAAIIDASCDNGACIESNQIPQICGAQPGTIQGKELTVLLEMWWTGCGNPEQDFDLILVQILRIPNSRINI